MRGLPVLLLVFGRAVRDSGAACTEEEFDVGSLLGLADRAREPWPAPNLDLVCNIWGRTIYRAEERYGGTLLDTPWDVSLVFLSIRWRETAAVRLTVVSSIT